MELTRAQRLVGVRADGKWGPVTALAIASRLPVDSDLLQVKVSEHFELRELLVSQTAVRKGLSNLPDRNQLLSLVHLAEYILEPVRLHFARPVLVSSGLRVPTVNRAVGGASGSQHELGEASDFTVAGLSNRLVCAWIAATLPFDQLIYEFGESGWIHCSYGPRDRRQTLSAVKVKKLGRMRTEYRPGLT